MFLSGVLLATHLTGMRRLPSVPQDVIHEMFLPCERFFAYVTTVWGLTCMFSNMIYHVLFAGKSFGAVLAAIWCLTSVTPSVIVQMLLPSKRFATHSADVWFICCVSLHMTLQTGGIGENVKAHGTGVHTTPEVALPMLTKFSRT